VRRPRQFGKNKTPIRSSAWAILTSETELKDKFCHSIFLGRIGTVLYVLLVFIGIFRIFTRLFSDHICILSRAIFGGYIRDVLAVYQSCISQITASSDVLKFKQVSDVGAKHLGD
jgi:hypothetical protein